jgi:tRNA (guanine37-N1)-methyltransferase
MRIDVFTIFPQMFTGPLDKSILKRARDAGLLDIRLHDPRDWTTDRHRTVDDRPFGGGAGMVMKAPPLVEAVESVLGDQLQSVPILLTSAAGHRFDQATAQSIATRPRLAIVCGHYEGVDHRVGEILGASEISIGDYVLTGGELPAMVIIDAVARLLPGVIQPDSVEEESHTSGLLEYPHYTRPRTFRGRDVPAVLLNGNHAEIARWRHQQSVQRTHQRDAAGPLTDAFPPSPPPHQDG